MKAFIIYGWSEGHWHGKQLRKELNKAGFTMAKRAEDADVIIAHSGGCYMIPDKSKANLVLLIGMPYWPGKHAAKRLREKIRAELKDLWWYKKTLYNTLYFFKHFPRWMKMLRPILKDAVPPYAEKPILLVRNKDDHFMHPTDTKHLADKHGWDLKVMRGHHDDIWTNPKPYVELITKSLSK